MKHRERFERVRSQHSRFSLRVRLTVLVTAELVLTVLLALGLYTLLARLFPLDSPLWLLLHLVVSSLLIGSVVTSLLSKQFFDPIKKLRRAMEQVADGDYTVRLDEKSSSSEVLELYSGFNLMVHELAATETLQSDFVSNVSHEFKTPINAIEGYSTLLQGSETLSEEEKRYVEKILFNTRRLSCLVGSILLLSKLENQQISTNQTCYRLDEQIRQSIVALESAWESKDIDLDAELERVFYTGSEAMMRHVWDNLIGNAVKFSPACGSVRISLRERDGCFTAAVEDSGPGISEQAKAHIFDKFYQADSSHKEEGNGLGLALVKRILALEHGAVCAENLPGGGCRFTVTLPQSHSSACASAPLRP